MKYLAGTVGAVVGAFLGGIDTLVVTLTAFVAVDYTSGVILAYIEKKIDSKAGAKGIAKKVIYTFKRRGCFISPRRHNLYFLSSP
jgi:phage-related holin